MNMNSGIRQLLSRLSSKILQLEPPCDGISNESKCEAQLKTDIAAKWRFASLQGYRAYEPDLAHANDHACDTATERKDGCDARRKFSGLVVKSWVVCSHSAFIQEVVAEGDALVNSEPVA
jgi:hypothetical protein